MLSQFNELPKAEKEPFSADARIDLIRHGKPFYTEIEHETGEFEGELSAESQEQVRIEAEEFSNSIDKEGELILIWASPKRRARMTAGIYREILEKNNIKILTLSNSQEGYIKTTSKLRDVKINTEYLDQLNNLVKKGEIPGWDHMIEHWGKTEKDQLPEGVESLNDVSDRVMKVLKYIEILSRKFKPEDGRKLHFLTFGHEEIAMDLLQSAYGKNEGVNKGTGPAYGEAIRIDMNHTDKKGGVLLDVNFRGKDSKISFNTESMKFEMN
jgi:broad specificity phosphatase PhoE